MFTASFSFAAIMSDPFVGESTLVKLSLQPIREESQKGPSTLDPSTVGSTIGTEVVFRGLPSLLRGKFCNPLWRP